MTSLSSPEAAPTVVRVLLSEPVGLLHYVLPVELRDCQKGTAVRVPLGRRVVPGYLYDLTPPPAPADVELKAIVERDGEYPPLPPTLLDLIVFAGDYYLAPYSEFLKSALPPRLRLATEKFVVTDIGRATLALGARDADQRVLSLGEKYPSGFSVAAIERVLETTRRRAQTRARKLVQKGWLTRRKIKRRALRETEVATGDAAVESAMNPTDEQRQVIERLQEALGSFSTFLLQGVTGSGKTEVYLQVIAETLKRGKTALVLVPEIALTPQLYGRFIKRFGEQVAIFHSGLSQVQRREGWERIRSGQARIGLGARSALFLPLSDIGVIVVDEEHESSFKQDEAPRYHGRDLAIVRGQKEQALVILGSATPSIESRSNVAHKRFFSVALTQRVMDRPLPEVQLVDLSKSKIGDSVFSNRLLQALEETLSAGEQAVLLLNRRGFAPYVFCRDCGYAYRCDACAVALTLHRARGRLICHYCGHEEMLPDRCESCHGHRVDAYGLGIERLEDELVQRLGKTVGIARLDRDHVRSRERLEAELDKFAKGEAQILIGTQMVAKGHDFPNVTLVGVVLADAGLHLPDFRAAERTFQVLTQVAGRAGRGEKEGRVVLQTYHPGHYAVATAAKHDYGAFVEEELRNRKDLNYPPYVHLALVRCEGEDSSATEAHAQGVAKALRAQAEGLVGVQVLGPAPAPLAKLRGITRVQVLVKAVDRRALRALLAAELGRKRSDIRRIIDVDPHSMM